MNHNELRLLAKNIGPEYIPQTITDLRGTVDWLNANQWSQGMMFNPLTQGRCGNGALMYFINQNPVEGADPVDDFTRRDLLACSAFYRVIGEDIITYNDATGRTKHQVIRAFETVADNLTKALNLVNQQGDDNA